MTLLTAAEIADLTSEHDASLIDTCQLRAPVDTTDGDGGYTQSWPTVTATVFCVVLDRDGTSASGGLIDIPPEQQARTVVLPRATTIDAAWRIVWSSQTLEVVDVTRNGTYGPAMYAHCVEV